MVGRQAFDPLFDAVELADPVERLLGDWRSNRGVHIKELAPDVCPTARFDDGAAGEQLVESGIAVGVDRPLEVLQVGPRVLTLAVGRVEEQRCRRSLATERPLITNVNPQPPGLGLAGAGCQNRHGRVVDMQRVRRHDLGGQGIDQRLECGRRCTDPAG